MLIVTVGTLVAGFVTKQACFAFGFSDSPYCYSDYGPLYYARDLAGGRFPYFPPVLEYPAALGLIIWLASSATTSAAGFAVVNMLFAAIACIVTAGLLWRDVGARALLFAAAPTVALYAFLNWDLVALVFSVGALAAFVRRRDMAAGGLLGIGTAVKLFPVLLVLPLIADRVREGDRRGAGRILLGATAAIALLNAPVAWASFDGWAYFFRFNATRPVDWGTLWSAGCQTFGSGLCNNLPLVNGLSLVAFVAAATVAWVLVTKTAPQIPRWQLGFPLMVVFLLANKVYSPQYSLWILPWFALVLPNLRLFVAYAAIDIGIYATTFAWQQHLTGSGGLPLWPLNVFILLRAILLLTMLVAFARRASQMAGSPAPRVGQPS